MKSQQIPQLERPMGWERTEDSSKIPEPEAPEIPEPEAPEIPEPEASETPEATDDTLAGKMASSNLHWLEI
ncbi:unnamed protein product [[Candida] boidinii]|nr:unnamed protein product [[Candida] boidinii]